MAVKIRLKRVGKKKAPQYRVVVADSRAPRDGRYIEQIGTYNPLTDPATINIDTEAADKWIRNGAQPTETVSALLNKARAAGTTEEVVATEEVVVAEEVETTEEAVATEDAEEVEAAEEAEVTEEAEATEDAEVTGEE